MFLKCFKCSLLLNLRNLHDKTFYTRSCRRLVFSFIGFHLDDSGGFGFLLLDSVCVWKKKQRRPTQKRQEKQEIFAIITATIIHYKIWKKANQQVVENHTREYKEHKFLIEEKFHVIERTKKKRKCLWKAPDLYVSMRPATMAILLWPKAANSL